MKKINFTAVIIMTVCLLFVTALQVRSQNVGIGVPVPTEKFQVNGIIFSDSVGFKFPDGSLQTRANNSYEPQDAAQGRYIVLLDNALLVGSFSFQEFVNKIKVIDFNWGYYHNVSEAAGTITDFCHYKLITVIKEVDASSPLFYQFFINGQNLGNTTFYFYRYDQPSQTFVKYFKIVFTDLKIVKYSVNSNFIGSDTYGHTETVTFWYDQGTNILIYWYGPPIVQYGAKPLDCDFMK